jgi:alpha-beta hydrolase superfamily lysophospholipase
VTPEVHRIEVQNGESVAIDWYPATPGARAALFVHGLGSNRRGEKAVHFGERFNENGWAFAALDLRGHGESDGFVRDLTMSGMLSDLMAATRWLGETGVAAEIVLIGSSMGAAVVAWHALAQAARTCPLVMIAPALKFPGNLASELTLDERDRWRRTGVHRFRSAWIDLELAYRLVEDGLQYDPDVLLHRHAAATLIIHGMRDDTVDWNDSLAFARRCHAPVDLFLIGEGDHRLTEHKELMFDILWTWLARQVNTGPASVDV